MTSEEKQLYEQLKREIEISGNVLAAERAFYHYLSFTIRDEKNFTRDTAH